MDRSLGKHEPSVCKSGTQQVRSTQSARGPPVCLPQPVSEAHHAPRRASQVRVPFCISCEHVKPLSQQSFCLSHLVFAHASVQFHPCSGSFVNEADEPSLPLIARFSIPMGRMDAAAPTSKSTTRACIAKHAKVCLTEDV